MGSIEKYFIAYVRVSGEKSREMGLSIDRQISNIKKFYHHLKSEDPKKWKNSKLRILKDEVYTGKNLNRPKVKELLDMVEQNSVIAVCVNDLSRLSRSLRDMLNLIHNFQKKKIAFYSLSDSIDTETSGGRLNLNIKGTLNQHYSDFISDRRRDSVEYFRNNNLYFGGLVPWGYSVKEVSSKTDGETSKVKYLVENKKEKEILELIRNMRSKGYGGETIAKNLDEMGIQPRKSKKWNPGTIRKLIKNYL